MTNFINKLFGKYDGPKVTQYTYLFDQDTLLDKLDLLDEGKCIFMSYDYKKKTLKVTMQG